MSRYLVLACMDQGKRRGFEMRIPHVVPVPVLLSNDPLEAETYGTLFTLLHPWCVDHRVIDLEQVPTDQHPETIEGAGPYLAAQFDQHHDLIRAGVGPKESEGTK